MEHVFLGVLTNGKVTEDKVGPHTDVLAEFPYVGPPHNAALMGAGPATVRQCDVIPRMPEAAGIWSPLLLPEIRKGGSDERFRTA